MSHGHALTLYGKGRLNVLISDVGVSIPYIGDSKTQKDLVIKSFKGVWDTGATGTVITKKVVSELNLKPTGQKDVSTANGNMTTNTYLVNIHLPMNVVIEGVVVTEGLLNNIDLLIGMDIIGLGDFSITNKDGITKMTFGVPSFHSHDYAQVINERNDALASKIKCHCGSGKRHIYCHGKSKK